MFNIYPLFGQNKGYHNKTIMYKNNYGLNITCVTFDKIIKITKKNKYTQNIDNNFSIVIDDANLDSISKILQN